MAAQRGGTHNLTWRQGMPGIVVGDGNQRIRILSYKFPEQKLHKNLVPR